MIVETRTGSYAKLNPSSRKHPDRSLFPLLLTIQGTGDPPAITRDFRRPRPKHAKIGCFFPLVLDHSRFEELYQKIITKDPKKK